MLRYSGTEGLDGGAGSTTTSTTTSSDTERAIDATAWDPRSAVIDLRLVHAEKNPVVVEAPERVVPAQDRRAVGRALLLIGHVLDGIALGLPLVVFSLVQSTLSMQLVALFAVVGTLLLWPTLRRGRLAVGPSEGLLSIIARVGLAPVVTLLIVSAVQVGDATAAPLSIDVIAIAAIILVTIPLIMLGRLISFRLVGLARSRGYDLEDTLIIGIGPVGLEVAKALQDNPQSGLVPCGFVDRFDDDVPLPLVGRPEHLPEILEQTGVRHVILAFGAAAEAELVGIVRRCQECDVQFYAVPRLFELGVSAADVGHEVSGLPVVPVRRPGVSAGSWPAKRVFDIVAASLLLLVMSPVFLLCALGVRLTSRGPIFFKQVRVGLGGRPFQILKFRTMKVNDDSATQWTVTDDDRITAVGSFLRPTHLDELPQLLNVLRGEMSLVGPRPERPHFVEQFSAEIDSYDYRHRVPVGITGWAQVNGYWGDTSIETRVRLDNRYIENWSLWRDLVIGLRTIPTLLGKRR